MNTFLRTAIAATLVAVLSSCVSTGPRTSAPQAAFYDRVAALCGQAFAGHITVDTPKATGPDPFAGKPLVMRVRNCSDRQVRIGFHVGDDRSRTWVVTRLGNDLRLKHDHRHADGSSDAVTMYGGDTAAAGTASRQEFPVDAQSQAMFAREGRTVSNSNVWAMEIEPGRQFVYELARPGGRLFRVEFDLSKPVAVPPAPWGADD